MKNMNHTPPNLMVGQQNYTRDRKRIRSRKEALLDFLSDGAWKANYQCAEAGGISYHCALYALRTEGWVIETRRVKGGETLRLTPVAGLT